MRASYAAYVFSTGLLLSVASLFLPVTDELVVSHPVPVYRLPEQSSHLAEPAKFAETRTQSPSQPLSVIGRVRMPSYFAFVVRAENEESGLVIFEEGVTEERYRDFRRLLLLVGAFFCLSAGILSSKRFEFFRTHWLSVAGIAASLLIGYLFLCSPGMPMKTQAEGILFSQVDSVGPIKKVPAGTPCVFFREVIGKDGAYSKVKLPDGTVGFLDSDTLRK